jgi:hypothetical protein
MLCLKARIKLGLARVGTFEVEDLSPVEMSESISIRSKASIALDSDSEKKERNPWIRLERTSNEKIWISLKSPKMAQKLLRLGKISKLR